MFEKKIYKRNNFEINIFEIFGFFSQFSRITLVGR